MSWRAGCLFFWLALSAILEITAQPVPGDVFRDYVWLPVEVNEEEKFLRVGGHLDYASSSEHFPQHLHHNGFITIDQPFDLKNASKAEVVIEKVLSHEGTKGLQIQINQSPWLVVPEAEAIPSPKENYMHHFNARLDLPLQYLHTDRPNTFRMQVDSVHPWDWPQHLIYGMVIRIYYDMEIFPDAILRVDSEGKNEEQHLHLNLEGGKKPPAKVVFLADFEGFNWEGDGIYRQWHYHYHQGKIHHTLGIKTEPPFRQSWSLEWVPDQSELMQVGAWLTNSDGLTRFIASHDRVMLNRSDYEVELLKPYQQPEAWVTRSADFSSFVFIPGDIKEVTAYQLAWTSWSPCYANGVYLNGHLIFMREGPCYTYYTHVLELYDTRLLISGENVVSTGKIPLFQGQMVHGMEVQWPGMMMKVKRNK